MRVETGAAGGAAAGATSRATASGREPTEEGSDTQAEPAGEAAAQGGKGAPVAGAKVTVSAPGVDVPQESVTASPGEGGSGSATAADPTKKGQEASRVGGAPGSGEEEEEGPSGGRAERAGTAQPSGRERHEKRGGEGVAVGGAVGVVVLVRIGCVVTAGERLGVGVGETDSVPVQKVAPAVDQVPAGQGVALTEERGQ